MLWILLFVAASALVWSLAYRLGHQHGQRDGETLTIDQLRDDLDKTAQEWARRGDAGEWARQLELPGILVVRKMI